MKFVLFAVLSLSLSSALAAADGPCAKDRESFCAGQKGHALMKCMKENSDKLSPECKAKHETMKAHMKDVKEACHEDAEKLCAGKKRKALMKCLKEKKDQVSDACKAEWKDLTESKN